MNPSPEWLKPAVHFPKSSQGAERLIGAGVRFDRTRRITGYLVGDLRRFNDAKRAEEQDRVKHG